MGQNKTHLYQLALRSRFNADLLPAIQNLTSLGCSESDIGVILGYSGKNPREWLAGLKKRNIDVAEACALGKKMARIALVARAFQAAVGYDYTETDIIYRMCDKDGVELKKPIPIEKKVKEKHAKSNPEMIKRLLSKCFPEEFEEDLEPVADEKVDEKTSKFLEKYRKSVNSKVVGDS